LPTNECDHIWWTVYARKAGIEDQLRYPRRGLNFSLQDVRLQREEQPLFQRLRRYLLGDCVRGLDEHLVGDSGGSGCEHCHSDCWKDIEVVGLARQERLPVEVNWRELDTRRIDRLSVRPGISPWGNASPPIRPKKINPNLASGHL
jgi:hypothetical protein